jgi:hypothetical protein
MKNRALNIASGFVMLSLTVAFVACGPQNKMKTISGSKIFGDKSSSEEKLGKDITGAALRKYEADQANPKSTASSAQPTNSTETQSFANRIQFLNVKKVENSNFLEVMMLDPSGERYDLVFSSSTPTVHKVINNGLATEESKLANPVTASFAKDQTGLLTITLNEQSSAKVSTVNAIIRTSKASMQLGEGQKENDDSKKLSSTPVEVRMVQLYYISQATHDAKQIIPVSSPANRIYMRTGDQEKGQFLVASLPGADDLASLEVRDIPGIHEDQDLLKIIADYEMNIKNKGLLLQSNAFQLIFTGKNAKVGQTFTLDVKLDSPVDANVIDPTKETSVSLPSPNPKAIGNSGPKADFSNVDAGSKSLVNFGNIEYGSATKAQPKPKALFEDGANVLRKLPGTKL